MPHRILVIGIDLVGYRQFLEACQPQDNPTLPSGFDIIAVRQLRKQLALSLLLVFDQQSRMTCILSLSIRLALFIYCFIRKATKTRFTD